MNYDNYSKNLFEQMSWDIWHSQGVLAAAQRPSSTESSGVSGFDGWI